MTSPEQLRRNSEMIVVSPEPVDPAPLLDFVSTPKCGAVALFLGKVRDHSKGKEEVTHLEYEAYDDVVVDKIVEIVGEAREAWDLERVSVAHRVGLLQVGEISVAVAVGSGHRAEGFSAARYIIDELKRRVPIWKKEHWPGGAEWVREDLGSGK